MVKGKRKKVTIIVNELKRAVCLLMQTWSRWLLHANSVNTLFAPGITEEVEGSPKCLAFHQTRNGSLVW